MECVFHGGQAHVRILLFRSIKSRLTSRLSSAASDLVDVRRRRFPAFRASSLFLGAGWGAVARFSAEEEAAEDFPWPFPLLWDFPPLPRLDCRPLPDDCAPWHAASTSSMSPDAAAS